MRLTLVRHGEAIPAVNGNDTKRPLSQRGHLQAIEVSGFLKDQIRPDIFVVSPLLRAQETLGYIQKQFKNVPVILCDAIKPEDDAHVAVEWLSQLPYESVVVVCHMNVVAHISSLLTGESFLPYSLAEARIFEQVVIAPGFSTQIISYIPKV